MQLPRLLLALIDPASAAMNAPNRRNSRKVYRGGAIFGPGVPGGSRQATQEELAAFGQRAEQRRRGGEQAPGGVHPDQRAAELAARELISTGTATLHGTKGILRPEVIKFWHGDSILHISVQDRPGESMTRIPRRLGPEHEELITAYLIAQLRRG
ncbi:MAG TPA: hypothetical protein VFT67_04260 [Jatrophihabitantaceae bacterium]|nr:hypothetical protein [Jatrophihabitantaceae bacterium]